MGFSLAYRGRTELRILDDHAPGVAAGAGRFRPEAGRRHEHAVRPVTFGPPGPVVVGPWHGLGVPVEDLAVEVPAEPAPCSFALAVPCHQVIKS